MSTQHRNGRTAAINISLTVGIIMLESWVADGIKGDALFPWLPGGALTPGGPWFVWSVVNMFLLAIVFAMLLYERRRSFLPVRVQRIGQPGVVEPRAVLVVNVSRPGWQWAPEQLSRDRGGLPEVRALPASLDDALEVMAALGERGHFFAWEQLLRAVREHARAPLRRLILIGSRGSKGSEESFPRCKKMIAHYFADLESARIEFRAVDFVSLDGLLYEYRQIVAEQGQRKGDVVIDITGGTKVNSIAAAMVTLEHPEVEFQYVETEDDKRVRTFNVVSGDAGEGS